ncbi:isochorismatase family protein [Pseudonocardia sp. RS010]|uniref:isochorismatase family protein n=1 Tax=Pseudonocardia sp. RS010 TaxID=3385979 RepID=UPI0039A2BF76
MPVGSAHCQNTYTRGLMELEGVQAALDQAEELLDRARAAGIPIVHVLHDAGPGTPYDVREEIGAIVDRVAPRSGEATVVKHYPNSFTGTELDTLLKQHPEVPAATLQAASLASVADLFGVVVADQREIPD